MITAVITDQRMTTTINDQECSAATRDVLRKIFFLSERHTNPQKNQNCGASPPLNGPVQRAVVTLRLVHSMTLVSLANATHPVDINEVHTLKTSVSTVRFVAVSAVEVTQQPRRCCRGRNHSRRGGPKTIQTEMCKTICAAWSARQRSSDTPSSREKEKERKKRQKLGKKLSAKTAPMCGEAEEKNKLMSALKELETACSTGLSGDDGLDVLMPDGLATLMPTVHF
eukprot:PhM_4_TR4340/c0_g1_i1/m.70615